MQIIVAIALICGAESCENKVQEPRFESLSACNIYLSSERMRLASQGHQVVLDDCIVTTEQRIKAFK
jgi:hypothetical protein